MNKLDYSLYNNATFYNNKSIDLNLNKSINKSNNITEFYLKDIDKNKTISNNYFFRKNMNNVCRIASKNNIIYNRVLKERKTHISLQNDYLINTHKTQHSCNSTLNHDKQNININNNIIININNSNYETLNTSTNKTIKSKSKNNSKNKKNSVEKNKKISKPKSIKKVKAKAIKINLAEKDNKKYFKIKEKELLKEEKEGINPKPIYNYMNDQKEINEQMRSILVDWIIDVHHKFGFTDETLFMTVLIIDRYSTIRQISRMQLQLLGITALMISCKHEEIELPKIDDFIYITDNAYTKQEMVKMENDILRALNFSLLFPSPIKFFEYLSINFNFSKKMHFMGKYLMETFLIDIKYIKYKASVISCACAYIVMKFFKVKGHQDSYNKKYYMLDENEDLPLGHGVKDCAQDICFLVDNINYSNYSSCFKKYSKIEFEKVALIIENK